MKLFAKKKSLLLRHHHHTKRNPTKKTSFVTPPPTSHQGSNEVIYQSHNPVASANKQEEEEEEEEPPIYQLTTDYYQPLTTRQEKWAEDRLAMIAARWNLSGDQQHLLQELETRLLDVDHAKNDPEEVVRFLVDQGTLAGAEKAFRRFIQFRIEVLDDILETYTPHPLLLTHFPMTLTTGFDKDDDGIWLERHGIADTSALIERFGIAELHKYCLWVREKALYSPHFLEYHQKYHRSPRVTVILDLQGLNRRHLRPSVVSLAAVLIPAIQEYYCGFIKKIIVVREPPIFKVLWGMVKPFLNANLKALVVFAGTNYLPVLAQYIDNLQQNLPDCLIDGGQAQFAEGMPQELIGGPLPPLCKSKKSKLLDVSATMRLEDSDSYSESEEDSEEVESEQECQPPIRMITTTTCPVNNNNLNIRGDVLMTGSF